MAVLPFMNAFAYKESGDCGPKHQGHEEAVETGQEQRVYHKAGQVCEKAGEGFPDMLCGLTVASGGIHGGLL